MLLPSSLIFPFRCSDFAFVFVVEAVVLPDGCCVEASCATAARQIESTSVNSVTPNRFILNLPPSERRAGNFSSCRNGAERNVPTAKVAQFFYSSGPIRSLRQSDEANLSRL